MMHYAFYFIFRWFLGKVLYFINLFSYLSIYFYIEFIRKPWMLLLTIKNLMVQNFSWLHDWVNHIALHIVETEILPNIYFNDKKASKRSQEKLLSIYDIIHPSIHLSSSNLFVFVGLFVFLLERNEGRERFHILFVLCLQTCPSSPTQSHSPSLLPTSLSLWDDAGINHLFHQSIFVNRLKSVLFDVGINTMVLLFIV